jgi:hypothetical protein
MSSSGLTRGSTAVSAGATQTSREPAASPPLPCRASPPQVGRIAGSRRLASQKNFATAADDHAGRTRVPYGDLPTCGGDGRQARGGNPARCTQELQSTPPQKTPTYGILRSSPDIRGRPQNKNRPLAFSPPPARAPIITPSRSGYTGRRAGDAGPALCGKRRRRS